MSQEGLRWEFTFANKTFFCIHSKIHKSVCKHEPKKVFSPHRKEKRSLTAVFRNLFEKKSACLLLVFSSHPLYQTKDTRVARNGNKITLCKPEVPMYFLTILRSFTVLYHKVLVVPRLAEEYHQFSSLCVLSRLHQLRLFFCFWCVCFKSSTSLFSLLQKVCASDSSTFLFGKVGTIPLLAKPGLNLVLLLELLWYCVCVIVLPFFFKAFKDK